jgi:hypothetical protein
LYSRTAAPTAALLNEMERMPTCWKQGVRMSLVAFGAVSQPFPIQIGVGAQDPGQGFNQACVQVSLHYGIEHHLSGIAHCLGTNMLEAGVTERRELSLKIVRWNSVNVERLWKRESRGRECIELRGLASEFSTRRP